MRLNDSQAWRAQMLARNGGFSHRFIAKFVLHKVSLDDVERDEIRAVQAALAHDKVRVTDWRNGLTPLSLTQARIAIRTKVPRKANKAS